MVEGASPEVKHLYFIALVSLSVSDKGSQSEEVTHGPHTSLILNRRAHKSC